MEFFDYHILASLLSLTALEIVLGIDNVVFIALIAGHLKPEEQKKARIIGLSLALIMRTLLLFSVAWIIGLKEPLINFYNYQFSGKDLLMLCGGLFLLTKGTNSIHDEVTGDHKEKCSSFSGALFATIVQIVFIDLIFSFDSVITAVGLTQNIPVIIIAMTIAMIVMILSASYISDFINKYPTLKILALAFILLIGVFLVAEGLGLHIEKGYIYFSMIFALGVETLNILSRRKKIKK